MVHNETQDGKGPVDVHFVIAMRQVERYIEEKVMDAVVHLDLLNAISHGNGTNGCAGELFDVDVKCEEAVAWSDALKLGEEEGVLV